MFVAPCPKRFETTRTSSGWETSEAILQKSEFTNCRIYESLNLQIIATAASEFDDIEIRKFDNLLRCLPPITFEYRIHLLFRQVLVKVVVNLDGWGPAARAEAFHFFEREQTIARRALVPDAEFLF